GEAAVLLTKRRRAGIAGAGAEAGALALGARVEQADLQRSGLARGGEPRCAHSAAGAAVAAHGDAETRDHESIAGGDRLRAVAERDRGNSFWQRQRQLEQRDVGGG